MGAFRRFPAVRLIEESPGCHYRGRRASATRAATAAEPRSGPMGRRLEWAGTGMEGARGSPRAVASPISDVDPH
jgi:hypothetical protein